MKALLPLLLLLGFSTSVRAQQKQTLYYKNGRKYMEGRWTYAVNSPISTNLIQTLMLSDERWMRNGEDYGRDFPNVGFVLGRSNAKDGPPTPALLSMICDGPITLWWPGGGKRAELEFKAGAANGPFSFYYPSGSLMAEGALTDGMPSGALTMYYENGQAYSTGAYTPYTQEELAAGWQKLFFESDSRYVGEDEDDLLEASNDTALVTETARYYFLALAAQTKAHSKRTGDFRFFERDGRPRAFLTYADDKRSGDWKVWGKSQQPTFILHYQDGRLTAVTDSTGRRETLASLVAGRLKPKATQQITRTIDGNWAAIAPDVVEALPQPATIPPSEVFSYVELMPAFDGDLQVYLSKNLRYPDKAKKEGIEGRVVVQFVVQANGSITDAKVQRGIGGGCDEEALRVIRGMPKWKPGKLNGKAVAVRYNLPVMFKLN